MSGEWDADDVEALGIAVVPRACVTCGHTVLATPDEPLPTCEDGCQPIVVERGLD